MGEITTQNAAQFDDSQLDTATTLFLQRKEANMREIVGKAYTELGRELAEARDRLARQGSKYSGVFEKWYTSLGFKKTSVYNYINRYNLVQQLNEVDEKERVEELPNNLIYEVAKPSAESTPAKAQAKAEVLDGEIDTLKEYRERIAELEAEAKRAESDKEAAEQRAELAEQIVEEKEFEVQELRQAAKPQIVERVVEKEVVPQDVQRKLAGAEAERDELDAALSKTYARIRGRQNYMEGLLSLRRGLVFRKRINCVAFGDHHAYFGRLVTPYIVKGAVKRVLLCIRIIGKCAQRGGRLYLPRLVALINAERVAGGRRFVTYFSAGGYLLRDSTVIGVGKAAWRDFSAQA
ncbi:hypothetical protein [Numidum massiliense]|uniref:hypothetical protein n=1 Tax=Numidum massiliense TaxID=1522315 RepID=UPI0006D569C1|nr:hypothetical protein [Numidum massiliense]